MQLQFNQHKKLYSILILTSWVLSALGKSSGNTLNPPES